MPSAQRKSSCVTTGMSTCACCASGAFLSGLCTISVQSVPDVRRNYLPHRELQTTHRHVDVHNAVTIGYDESRGRSRHTWHRGVKEADLPYPWKRWREQ